MRLNDLVSIRSGAPISMPGMMDSILNVGVIGTRYKLYKKYLGSRLTANCAIRFLESYGKIALNMTSEDFEASLKSFMELHDIKSSNMKKWYIKDLDKLVKKYSILVKLHREKMGDHWLPLEIHKCTQELQYRTCIRLVFESWMSQRAIAYRAAHNIPTSIGTACIIQKMVFGNRNMQSGSGVLFTRNPVNGKRKPYGEFIIMAQGEDIVSGQVTPKNFNEMPSIPHKSWKNAHKELKLTAGVIEDEFKDMQDIEWTLDDGKLYILQTRNGKRSAEAKFVIAHDLVHEKVISQEEAVKRVTGKDFDQLTKKLIDYSKFKEEPSFIGIGTSGGLLEGYIVLKEKDIRDDPNMIPIYLAKETTPDDFPIMSKCKGILTQTGGVTSHAAVVARSMDITAVVGGIYIVLK